MGSMEHQECPEQLVLKVLKEQLALKVLKEQLALRVLKAQKVIPQLLLLR
jgi:hypothetical protein